MEILLQKTFIVLQQFFEHGNSQRGIRGPPRLLGINMRLIHAVVCFPAHCYTTLADPKRIATEPKWDGGFAQCLNTDLGRAGANTQHTHRHTEILLNNNRASIIFCPTFTEESWKRGKCWRSAVLLGSACRKFSDSLGPPVNNWNTACCSWWAHILFALECFGDPPQEEKM